MLAMYRQPSLPWVSHPWIVKPMESQMYSLYCVILYKKLEHPQILVSTGAPGTNPPWMTIPVYNYYLFFR